MKTMLLAMSCALLLGSAAWADSASGLRAYRSGLYDVAAQEFRREAQRGDAEAQFRLGSMYADGIWFAKDLELAKEWLGKAAINGHEGALRRLESLSASERKPSRTR